MTKKRAKMKMIAVEVQAKSPMIQLSVSKIILLLFCWFKIMNFILISSNSCLYLQRLRKWQKNKWTKWKSYCLFKNHVLKSTFYSAEARSTLLNLLFTYFSSTLLHIFNFYLVSWYSLQVNIIWKWKNYLYAFGTSIILIQYIFH